MSERGKEAMAETAQPLKTTGGAEILLREDRGATAILTLNRPEARNPLSEALLAEFGASLDEISSDKTIKAVVLAANGPAFCAGHDLKEMTAHRADSDRGRAYYAKVMSACSAVMQAIVKLPKPVIAAIEGPATAAGCQLVASCDLAVAGESARFCTPGVNIGLFCSTPMVALSRNVSRKHAMEMLLLGNMINAETAQEFGLINRVTPRGEALGKALELAEQIAQKSPAIVKIGKEAFYRQIEMPLQAAYDYATEVMVTNMLHRDAEEGIGAFIEKRPPDWHDT
jgi:enoyl-CoA hydratase/carnithine racemase